MLRPHEGCFTHGAWRGPWNVNESLFRVVYSFPAVQPVHLLNEAFHTDESIHVHLVIEHILQEPDARNPGDSRLKAPHRGRGSLGNP